MIVSNSSTRGVSVDSLVHAQLRNQGNICQAASSRLAEKNKKSLSGNSRHRKVLNE